MHYFGKKKTSCLKDKMIIAAALTVSCAALFVLYDILLRSYTVSDILRCAEDCCKDAPIVHEEDTGDAYEI